ncbi:MAG: prepilin-type N-terminal cleavage/methylation domain-containing protein [Deltaproteobacteria bacterium]|nr:prepilin-type N-terminal cleavage/methylation domain-containing protein [Deltaproteobacteria bacterium]
MDRTRDTRERGVSLVEVLVTMALMSIVLSLGVPELGGLIADSRMVANVNDLVRDASAARSEAIKRGGRVTLCTSNNGATCVALGDWALGWIAWVDTNGNAAVDHGEQIVRVHGPAGGEVGMVGTVAIVDYVSFTGTGEPRTSAGAIQTGSVKVCDGRAGNVGKQIALLASGSIRSAEGVACP